MSKPIDSREKKEYLRLTLEIRVLSRLLEEKTKELRIKSQKGPKFDNATTKS